MVSLRDAVILCPLAQACRDLLGGGVEEPPQARRPICGPVGPRVAPGPTMSGPGRCLADARRAPVRRRGREAVRVTRRRRGAGDQAGWPAHRDRGWESRRACAWGDQKEGAGVQIRPTNPAPTRLASCMRRSSSLRATSRASLKV